MNRGNDGRLTVWLYCDMAERMEWNAVKRAEIVGGVVFCTQCGGTLATHRRALMRDGRLVSVSD